MPGKRFRTETGFRPSRTLALQKKQAKQRNARRRSDRVVVPRDKLGFATSMVSTLRYTERLDLAPSGTDTVAWSFRANDMFDPLANTGGHQPRGFDNLMALYENFTVTSSKISVNWMYEGYNGPTSLGTTGHLIQGGDEITDAPALAPVICGIMRSADTYGSALPVQKQMEKDRTNWTVLTPTSGARVTSSRSQLSEFFGKQDLVAADGYSGTSAVSPQNQAYYHIFAARGSDDYPAGTCKVTAFVTIEYRATFTKPLPLAES